jgi:NitT/TauT family transport system substrate-binding protein
MINKAFLSVSVLSAILLAGCDNKAKVPEARKVQRLQPVAIVNQLSLVIVTGRLGGLASCHRKRLVKRCRGQC